jgi:hypothetical protein
LLYDVSIARANPGYRRSDIAKVARWATQAANGQINSDRALPDCAVPLPLHATIERIVLNFVVTGIQTSVNVPGYQSVQGMYVDNKVKVTEAGLGSHQLWHSYDIIPVAHSAIFDSTQVPPIGQNRLFYGLYSGGDREVGLNFRTAWGGPAHTGVMTVALESGIFTIGTPGSTGCQLAFALNLRVLYYL